MFCSSVRTKGDRAGVFEYDGETGYFYLYATTADPGQKVLASIHIFSGVPEFSEVDIAIRWTTNEEKVGLFIRNELWAVFDRASGQKYGGNYRTSEAPRVPADLRDAFNQSPYGSA